MQNLDLWHAVRNDEVMTGIDTRVTPLHDDSTMTISVSIIIEVTS